MLVLGMVTGLLIFFIGWRVGVFVKDQDAKRRSIVARNVCICDHTSTKHADSGQCLEQVVLEVGPYANGQITECKCQRYQGPMGLAELDLWGVTGGKSHD